MVTMHGDDRMRARLGSVSVTLAQLMALSLVLPASAHAQDAAAQDAAAAVDDGNGDIGNGDIVVTARKRSETVQDVPISIDVVAGEAVGNAAVTSLVQIETLVPGLNFTKAPTGNEVGVTIRGLGSAPGDPSFESSVSLFVDGVYAPRAREFSSALFDIERMEVVKGTQAALLGKNTSLGAINLITRRPGSDFGLNIRGAYDFELGSRTVEAGVDIPFGDTLRLRLSGQSSFDGGWVRNALSGTDAQRSHNNAGRATLVWEPGNGIDVTGTYQYGRVKSRGLTSELITPNPAAAFLQQLAGAPGTLDFTLDRRNATSIGAPGTEQSDSIRNERASLVINIPLGNHTLTSVTGYSVYRNLETSDTDMLAGRYLTRDVNERGQQISQEVRIASPGDATFDYVVGATYIENKLDNVTINAAAYPFGPPASPTTPIAGSFRNSFYQKSQTISAFAQATLSLSDALRLQGGLRFTNEEKNARISRTVVVPGLFSLFLYPPFVTPLTPRDKENNLDYSFGVQYDVADRIMLYASYGQGTKAGGFASSVTNLAQSPYNSERARTAEIGIKAQDASRRFTLNAAAFNSDVSNFQVVTFNGQAFTVTNADLRSRGVEGEMIWAPVTGFRLFANATYADVQDKRTRFDIPLAPRFSSTAGFTLTREMVGTGLAGTIEGSVSHRSSRSYQQDPAVPRGDAFTTLNISAAIGAQDESWELRLIGRNMTNANEASFVFPVPIIGGFAGISERPRTVTLQLSAKM